MNKFNDVGRRIQRTGDSTSRFGLRLTLWLTVPIVMLILLGWVGLLLTLIVMVTIILIRVHRRRLYVSSIVTHYDRAQPIHPVHDVFTDDKDDTSV